MIVADILTVDEARAALGWAGSSNLDHSAELSTLYIPAVTEILTAEVGTLTPVPAAVALVARRMLNRLWNADHQGTGGQRPDGTASAPGQLTAEDLLLIGPYRLLGGFA